MIDHIVGFKEENPLGAIEVLTKKSLTAPREDLVEVQLFPK